MHISVCVVCVLSVVCLLLCVCARYGVCLLLCCAVCVCCLYCVSAVCIAVYVSYGLTVATGLQLQMAYSCNLSWDVAPRVVGVRQTGLQLHLASAQSTPSSSRANPVPQSDAASDLARPATGVGGGQVQTMAGSARRAGAVCGSLKRPASAMDTSPKAVMDEHPQFATPALIEMFEREDIDSIEWSRHGQSQRPPSRRSIAPTSAP